VQTCPQQGFVTVDVASLFGGAASVPPTTWRLTHESGGVPQAIPDSDVMLFVDLHATGDVVFDRPFCGTGEQRRPCPPTRRSTTSTARTRRCSSTRGACPAGNRRTQRDAASARGRGARMPKVLCSARSCG